MPGSPTMSTVEEAPRPTASISLRSRRCSLCRPMSAGSPARASGPGSSGSLSCASSRANTTIGSSKPRSSRGPSSRNCARWRPRTSATVVSATSTVPPSASAHSRAASIAAAPNQSVPSRTRSPELSPTRSPPATPPISTRRARSRRPLADSSAAVALSKVAITPSPTPFTTTPPAASTTRRLDRSNSVVTVSATSAPTALRHAVDPTTSVNRTVFVSGRAVAMRQRMSEIGCAWTGFASFSARVAIPGGGGWRRSQRAGAARRSRPGDHAD